MKIQVTLEDVLKGQRRKADGCMVALAIKRQVPWLENVQVCAPHLAAVHDHCYMMFPLPALASKKIRAFDRNGFVLPFSFELDVEQVRMIPPRNHHGLMNALLSGAEAQVPVQ